MMQQNNCRLYLKVLLLSKLQVTKAPDECGSRRKCGTCAAHCFTPEKGVSAARCIILVRQRRDCKWLIRTDLCIIEDIKPECLVLVLLRQENSGACYLLDCIEQQGKQVSWWLRAVDLVTPREDMMGYTDSSACYLLDCN